MGLKSIITCTFVALMVWAAGCSSGGVDPPMLPGSNDVYPTLSAQKAYGTTYCLGLWSVAVDKSTGLVDIAQLRGADLALNVLSVMEPPTFKSLNIDFGTLVADPANNYLGVDVILTHPINDPTFMGFDVRGIVFGPRLINADGMTEFMNPDDFSQTPFGYKDGLLGVPDSIANYSDDYYGYKYFCDSLGKNDDLATFMSNMNNLDKRGVFSNGTKNTRHYDLSWEGLDPPLNFLVFNYAIYANYAWPTGEPPIDIEDFDITTANSAEPFCASITEVSNAFYYAGGEGHGSISIDIEIWDWQGAQSLEVTIESPGVIPLTDATSYGLSSLPTDKVYMYQFVEIPGTPTGNGDLDIFITATDPSTTFGMAWFMGLLAYNHPKYNTSVYTVFRHTAEVLECPNPYVASIDPNRAIGGYVNPSNYNNAVITGSAFVPGVDLAVELTKAGEMAIVASDVKCVSNAQITCDLNFSGAVLGWWALELTNGCGTTSVLPNALEVVEPADPVGNITLEVQRWNPPGDANHAIDHTDNILLNWDDEPTAVEYAIYADHNPYNGFNNYLFEGTTDVSEFEDTLNPDEGAVYIVRARSVAGETKSEAPDSQIAFVDFEQAESNSSVGSWYNNTFYDYPDLRTTKADSSQKNSGNYGWYDQTPNSSYYRYKYEVFHSDPIPEISEASVYRFEVVWDVDYYYHTSTYRDGFTFGWIAQSTPPYGWTATSYGYLRTAPLISGPAYATNIQGIYSQFPNSHMGGVSYGSGYTGGDSSRNWQLSVGNVSAIEDTNLDYLCVAHATSYWYSGGGSSRYYRVDDIAIVIY